MSTPMTDDQMVIVTLALMSPFIFFLFVLPNIHRIVARCSTCNKLLLPTQKYRLTGRVVCRTCGSDIAMREPGPDTVFLKNGAFHGPVKLTDILYFVDKLDNLTPDEKAAAKAKWKEVWR